MSNTRTLPAHHLVALNTASASENKIHDDEVAALLGFGGGLVPGVDVYAYLCQPAVALWGPRFLERGRAITRFGAPVYDGEAIEVRAELDDDDQLTASIHSPTGSPAWLQAELDDRRPQPPSLDTAPQPDADQRPAASPQSLAVGTTLGTFAHQMSQDEHRSYLASIRDESSPLDELGLVHPGALLKLANSVLSETVALGPWMHVGSEIHHYGPIAIGEQVEVRGVVTDHYEHKGHRFVDLDVVVLGDGPGDHRLWIEHKSIYEPRQLRNVT